jgi:hypothetical protein
MPVTDVTYQFPRNEYPSLQIGDLGYYAAMQNAEVGGFEVNNPNAAESMVFIGPVKAIDHTTTLSDGTLTTTITFEIDVETTQPTVDEYIFFAKSDRIRIMVAGNPVLLAQTNQGSVGINTVSPIGYFGSAKFVNGSSSKAEMYATTCEVSESSK